MNVNNPMLHDNRHKGTFVDYGSFAIPATTTGAWRTLSKSEWNFLVSRPSQNIGSPLGDEDYACFAYVKVNGVTGMMLFPDLFEWPTTVEESLIPGTLNKMQDVYSSKQAVGQVGNPHSKVHMVIIGQALL